MLMREKLIKDIIQFHIDNNIFMHEHDFARITGQIC